MIRVERGRRQGVEKVTSIGIDCWSIHVEKGNVTTPEASSYFKKTAIMGGGGGEKSMTWFKKNGKVGGPGYRALPLSLVMVTL
jgi:hypothetical protein